MILVISKDGTYKTLHVTRIHYTTHNILYFSFYKTIITHSLSSLFYEYNDFFPKKFQTKISAFVEFWNTDACEKAGTLNGKNLLGRPIRMDWSD